MSERTQRPYPSTGDEQLAAGADVVVVGAGAGLAGLVAAADLARAGHAVTVVDRAAAPGGRAATHEADGFHWNLGPHALYVRGHARRTLTRLGIDPKGGRPSASGGFALEGGRKHALPAGFVSLLSTSLLAPSAKLELGKLLSTLPRLDASSLEGMSVAEWKRAAVRNPSVAALVSALVRLTTYTAADDRMCAAAAVEQLQLALSANVEYLDGGWQVMVDALDALVRAAGGRIVGGARAQAVESNGAVTAVRLADGRTVDARAVVLAVPPKAAAALLAGRDGRAVCAAAERAVPTRAACLDLALDRLPVARARFALGIDRPSYFSVHSAVARVAPAGGATVHVMRYLPPGESVDAAACERELEGVLDLVQPGWRGVVHARRFLPALTVQGDYPRANSGGKTGRAPVEVAGVGGLYLAGDWVGPAGLLADCAVASGAAAAAACSGYLASARSRAA